jgi:hypothetical protein
MKNLVASPLLAPFRTLLALLAGVFQLVTVMFLLALAVGLAGWKILSLRNSSKPAIESVRNRARASQLPSASVDTR